MNFGGHVGLPQFTVLKTGWAGAPDAPGRA
jgi:hypothetical protein